MNSTIVKLLVVAGFLILWSSCQKEEHPEYAPPAPDYTVGQNPVSGCDTATFQRKIFDAQTGISFDKTCVKDFRDDNVYPLVKIGNQIWMAENLRYDAPGSGDTSLSPCSHGRFYTWASISQNACPQGFRLPSQSDYHPLMYGMYPLVSITITLGLTP